MNSTVSSEAPISPDGHVNTACTQDEGGSDKRRVGGGCTRTGQYVIVLGPALPRPRFEHLAGWLAAAAQVTGAFLRGRAEIFSLFFVNEFVWCEITFFFINCLWKLFHVVIEIANYFIPHLSGNYISISFSYVLFPFINIEKANICNKSQVKTYKPLNSHEQAYVSEIPSRLWRFKKSIYNDLLTTQQSRSAPTHLPPATVAISLIAVHASALSSETSIGLSIIRKMATQAGPDSGSLPG